MNDTRARFEEIWPVPEGVYWSPVFGAYVCAHGSPVKIECMELNLRLDTFTRCQETTDVYVSLVDEMVSAMDDLIHYTDEAYSPTLYSNALTYAKTTMDRAKQIMEKKK